MKKINRIHSLESLRGLLALWVVVGHTIKHSGYSDLDLGPLKFLAMPGLAVDIFIILSGFVIFFLLDTRPTAYREFIVRRWFRLAPVYFAVLIVSVLTLDWQAKIIAAFPWKNAAVTYDLALHLESIKYLPSQLIAHAVMMHGAIADKFLPGSQYAFVGQAWSISVEWQFYLIAPLIYLLVRAQAWYRLSASILVVCILRAVNYGGEGFAINQAGYFLVGIVSYYVWKHCSTMKIAPSKIDMLAIVAAALIFLLLSRTISLLLWVAVLVCAISEARQQFSKPQRYFVDFLQLPLLQWLGKISYSVYMTHMLVLYFLTQLLFRLLPDIAQHHFVSIMVPATVGITILVSVITYRLLEQPGISAGQRFTIQRKLVFTATPSGCNTRLK